MHYVDIIILLAVVIVLVFRLRDVLGTRNEDEPTKSPVQLRPVGEESVKDSQKPRPPQPLSESQMQNIEKLQVIKKADHGFHPIEFIDKAKQAFEIVLAAFDKKDYETLNKLLAPKLWQVIEPHLKDLESQDINEIHSIHKIKDIQVVDVFIDSNQQANVTVDFITEQSKTVRQNDQLRPNDTYYHEEITDRWTFGRKLNDDDPIWYLLKTETIESD